MMIKFLAHGTGSAAKAADYLTRERFPAQDQEQDQDQEKNPEEVKVLRGNPDQVAAVADSLEFEHKYTSGVIAWSPEDAPSDAQIDRGGGRVREDRLGRGWNRTATPGRLSCTEKRAVGPCVLTIPGSSYRIRRIARYDEKHENEGSNPGRPLSGRSS